MGSCLTPSLPPHTAYTPREGPSVPFWPDQQPSSPGIPPGHHSQTSLDKVQQGREGKILGGQTELWQISKQICLSVNFRFQGPPLNGVLSNSLHVIHFNHEKALASFEFLTHVHSWFKSQGHRRAVREGPSHLPHRLPVGPLWTPLSASANGSLPIHR